MICFLNLLFYEGHNFIFMLLGLLFKDVRKVIFKILRVYFYQII